MKKVAIIGAGLGGLSAACRLARMGFSVEVFEKNETIGGKVNLIEAGGYKFDTGASLITMKSVFEDLFEFCGEDISRHIGLIRLDPICRYFWGDGCRLDASPDAGKMAGAIAQVSPSDAAAFEKYLADSRQKYEIAEKTFLAHSLNDLPKVFSPAYLPDLFRIASLSSLDSHNGKYFKSPKIKQLFNRFATYNGSSPYQAPATFALIPYAEFGLGAWYAKGGIYEVPKAVGKLAKALGVKIFKGAGVEKIEAKKGKATGIWVNGDLIPADYVVSNADAVETYRSLLSAKKYEKREPSCSGFVLLLGARKKFDQLSHHNIFFSSNYKAEFESIFKRGRPADEPTIYLCATSRSDQTQAPEGCENLFVLINAPYLNSATDWEAEAGPYRDKVIKMLEGFGLEGLEKALEFEKAITPLDFEKCYGANKGSIYGISSNGIFSAFMRIPNRSREIQNLYFAGGAAHPGGGMPLVALSGKMVAAMIGKAAGKI